MSSITSSLKSNQMKRDQHRKCQTRSLLIPKFFIPHWIFRNSNIFIAMSFPPYIETLVIGKIPLKCAPFYADSNYDDNRHLLSFNVVMKIIEVVLLSPALLLVLLWVYVEFSCMGIVVRILFGNHYIVQFYLNTFLVQRTPQTWRPFTHSRYQYIYHAKMSQNIISNAE